MGFFSRFFGKRTSDRDKSASNRIVEAVGTSPSAPDPALQEHPDGPEAQTSPTIERSAPHAQKRTPPNWRESEGHQQILLYFRFPNSTENLPRSYDWAGMLGESVESAVRRLVADGALRHVTEAKWRILYRRGGSELKELCRSHGLKVSGTKEQLAERLAGIDPTGDLLGTKNTLYMCSDEAAQFIEANRHSLEVASGDMRELRGMFSLEEFEAEKRLLLRRFSEKGYGPPSSDDVKWALLNKKTLQHAKEGNLGLCGNVYFAMAGFQQRRDKLKAALPLYLLVCAYDLNGAQNRGGLSGKLLEQFPLFDRKMSSLAPAVVEEVRYIMEALPVTLDEVSKIFAERSTAAHFPLPAERTWPVLALAIEGNIDLNEQPDCFEKIRKLLSEHKSGNI